jgi:hypothetical protein
MGKSLLKILIVISLYEMKVHINSLIGKQYKRISRLGQGSSRIRGPRFPLAKAPSTQIKTKFLNQQTRRKHYRAPQFWKTPRKSTANSDFASV